LMGEGRSSVKDIGDMDIKEAAAVIAQHLDESLMSTIVLPLFAESKVFSVEQKRFIKSAPDIDHCFTSDKLLDLYMLIWEVGKFQFSPFFAQIAERFGVQLGAASLRRASPESSTKT
jgi:hypothetical protein